MFIVIVCCTGIIEGDEILSINGKPVRELDMAYVESLLSQGERQEEREREREREKEDYVIYISWFLD